MLDKQQMIELLKRNLDECESVNSELVETAIQLFRSLPNKPPIHSSNEVVGILDDNGEYKHENILKYYSQKETIKFLIFWVESITPILDILYGVGKLPLVRRRETNFEEFLNATLIKYKNAISSLTSNEILNQDEVNLVVEICDSLSEVACKYLEGFPGESYELMKNIMNRIEALNLKPISDFVGQGAQYLFKMRLGNSNRVFSRDEMFHIPFESRGLVKTNRYSIPGLPCVYLGRTPLTCWEEMGKPDLNTTHTSLFEVTEELAFFDISIPPEAFGEFLVRNLKYAYGIEDMLPIYSVLKTYLIMLPVVASCSIRVSSPEDTFKPEYIVPQLLLQWVQQSARYDGISYFSTKIDRYTLTNYWLYQNYAFPVKERRESGSCIKLKSKFKHITNAIPWQIFQLHKDNLDIIENSAMLELTPGLTVRYNRTDFGRLESFLIDVLIKED